MFRDRRWRLVFSGIAALALVTANAADVTPTTVREPAVAGLFYPKDPAALAKAIDGYLAAAKTTRSGELKALICPHAGYPYSGPVAASGFHLLTGLSFDTVILLGPAHYALLDQASVSGADAFRTPLGDVPLSRRARDLAATPPFALDPRCYVQRPEWASQSSRRLPPPGADRADTWEHSLEVEVPFLQKTLRQFQLVPVVMGDADPVRAARALSKVVDDRTLLVVSSDLSHYHPYTEATTLDRHCVDAICALDVKTMSDEEACGRIPILTLLHLARERGWRAQLLDLRNSGDTSGDKSRVVGYAAIAFYAPASASSDTLGEADRRLLLALARRNVEIAAGRTPRGAEPAVTSPALLEKKGVFVTLTKRGELRGCIGNIVGTDSVTALVRDNARNAAIHDPRFSPISPSEVKDIEIEISVLSVPQPLAFTSPDDLLRKLRPHVDGVVLRIPAGGATYLPQVWEQIPDKTEFLDTLAMKAGGRPGDWRKPGTSVAVYQVESFKEADFAR